MKNQTDKKTVTIDFLNRTEENPMGTVIDFHPSIPISITKSPAQIRRRNKTVLQKRSRKINRKSQ